MSHLGDRVSAFVDDQLSLHERDRVVAHLARCADCRAEVEEQRALKSRLRGLAAPVAPVHLLESLRGLPAPGQGGPRHGVRHVGPAAVPRRVGVRRGETRRPSSPATSTGPGRGSHWWSRSVRRRALAGAAALGAAASLVVAGGGGDGGPAVRPPVSRFTVEHASVTGNVPLVDPAGLVEVGGK